MGVHYKAGIHYEALLKVLLSLFILIPLLTACPSQSIDDVQPAMTLLGDAERSTSTSSIVLEGELQDNQKITAFSYRLNGGQTQDVLDSLGLTLYRFSVPELQEGKNTIELTASDPNGNTTRQDIMVHFIPGISGQWKDQSISYTACADNHQAILELNLNASDTSLSGPALSGTVKLELSGRLWVGSFEGFQDNQNLQGALSLSDSLGQVKSGQLMLNLSQDTLSGQALFKEAIPCSSSQVDDLELSLELIRASDE